MASPVSSIRNLGPSMEAAFARAGVTSAEELRALGPDEGYRRLLAAGERPHFIAYYVLVMGLQGRPWNDCKGEEKARLRRRFDALKAGATDDGRWRLEAQLDALGLPRRRGQGAGDTSPDGAAATSEGTRISGRRPGASGP